MRVDDFIFDLPEELIAQYPLPERRASRLLVLESASGNCQHHPFAEIENLLQPNDLLIFNDTRVIPARLFATKKTGGRIEILVERILTNDTFLAHVRASKALKPGAEVFVTPEICLSLVARHDSLFELKLKNNQQSVLEMLTAVGHMPLPPYITRGDEASDTERYQTVFARVPGAVAAPTAGLHFDEALLSALTQRGIDIGFVTLHVGAGTFQPVRVDHVADHKMHAEYFEVSSALCQQVAQAHKRGGRIVAVGTTVVRSLEAAACEGVLQPFCGETKIFIYPGYRFQVVDALVTNFHLPKSTLLMLVCAFAGQHKVLNAYREAVQQQYRFFSYGDAMFLTRDTGLHMY